MKTLTDVQNFLDKIPFINSGGCGLSALAMYRWLKANNKLVGDEHFIYLYTKNDNTYKLNERRLRGKRPKLTMNSASHIMLYHNGECYDSEGNAIREDFIFEHSDITEEVLIESLNYGSWNDMFDRAGHISKIAKKLKIDLSDICEYNLYEW